MQQHELYDGFGMSTPSDLDALRKALSIGVADPLASTDGNALRVESLEGTLTALTFTARHVRMWQRIFKKKARSTVEEYARLDQYGGNTSGFVDPGATPEEEDSTYSRMAQHVKYVGTTRGIQHPATLINTVPQDLITQETTNGVLWMLGKIEAGLFYGDSSVVPQEWDGIFKQVIDGDGYILDLRGQQLADTHVEEASNIIADNYGIPQVLFANQKVFSEFSMNYYGQQRWQSPNSPAGLVGTPVKGMSTQAGDVIFDGDMFMRTGQTAPVTATHDNAPETPSVSAGPARQTQGGPPFSSLETGLFNGATPYSYTFTAFNQYGESAPTALLPDAGEGPNPIEPDGNEYVWFTLEAGGGTTVYGYNVYRCLWGGTPQFVKRIGTDPENPDINGYDDNSILPNAFDAILCDMQSMSLAFKQLSPLIKMPLAVTSPSIRWMQLLYGTPVVYTPKRHVIFRNIGQRGVEYSAEN